MKKVSLASDEESKEVQGQQLTQTQAAQEVDPLQQAALN